GAARFSGLGRSADRWLVGVRCARPAEARASRPPTPHRRQRAGGDRLRSLQPVQPLPGGARPQPVAYLYPETEQRTESPVLPRFTDRSAGDLRAYFRDPPFVPPPAERIRLWNYWLLSRRLATPTFLLTATGFGLMVYAAFVWLCDARS